MGRLMPTECAHGRIRDWGDFGDEDGSPPEPCPECDVETDRIRRLADAEQAVIAAAEAETDHRRAPRDSIKWYREYARRVWALEAAVTRLRAAREGSEQ